MNDQTTPTLDEAVARMNASMAALRVALDALLPLTERSTAAAATALGGLQDGWDARREAAAARPYGDPRDEMDRELRAEVASLERHTAALVADRDQWRQAYEATGAPGGAAAVEQLRAQLAEAREKYEALARPVREPVPAGVLDWARDEARACGGPGILGYDDAVERTRRRVIGELWCRWDDAKGVYPGQATVWLQEVNDAMHQVVADARRAAEARP